MLKKKSKVLSISAGIEAEIAQIEDDEEKKRISFVYRFKK